MYKILLIEDDKTIASSIESFFVQWGYQVKIATNFEDILEEFTSFQPHLVLLDIGLPFFNGFHWCSEIRNISNTPIVFLSSANDSLNIVMAMNQGGDEFIEKPFDLNVLLAKSKALLRRAFDFPAPEPKLEYLDAVLNLQDASLSYKNHFIELTKNEFKILQILMEHLHQIVRREDIISHLWESDSFVDDNTLTVNINRLRKKLEEYGLTDFILTKKGIGYLIGGSNL